ncbi:MLO-like protein 1-like [Dorcoceras hygrometricum]|uniref:MLO-like protein n=1 Tax=Dorcoceras hygrometricum TaxID=472368 RepID=A0A2Z7BU61_9LAMI|nr:MLO-like protein 1-like [Dorcoceras hygrometricum]
MAGGGGEGVSLEFTPTWVVALVCTVIVAISLAAERFLHFAGKYLMKKNQGALFQALQKIKEELMLLGFISLMLIVFQDRISKICIPEHFMNHWLPCNKVESAKSTAHFELDQLQVFGSRHLLAAASDASGYCEAKGKAPLLSLKALHDLHIFIFVLAVSHIIFSAATIVLGGLKIRQWRHWEDLIQKKEYDPEEAMKKITHVKDDAFIRGRVSGIARIAVFSWLKSFFKQFYGSVKKSEYTSLRHGFITAHCKGNPKFNFHNYMVRAFERDFKKVVGISWYLWVIVVLFLLVNVSGWHAYFWISFVPLALLLAVGTKLEHIITELAIEVADKHIAVEGDVAVKPSDDYFWFHRPRLVLLLIHVLLFQNAFEIAVFFWMLVTFGFDSCIMGEMGFIIPRLVLGYSTLPLYAIVAQMGSSFNEAIFDDYIKVGLLGWAQKAKLKNKGNKSGNSTHRQVSSQESPIVERGKAQEIELN